MGFLDKFRKKKQEAIPQNEELENQEEENRRFEDFVDSDEEEEKSASEERKETGASATDFDNDDEYDDNPFAGMEQKIDTTPVEKESRSGKRLKGGLVAGIAAALAMTMVGYTAYNFIKPKENVNIIKTKDLTGDTKVDTLGSQKSALPESYSELAKYENLQRQRQREELIRSGKLNPAKEQANKLRAENEAKYPQRPTVTPPPTPPARPSLPQQSGNLQTNSRGVITIPNNGGGAGVPSGGFQAPQREQPMYNSPVGFSVTESGKVASNNSNSVFTALAGTNQATGKKYKLHTGTVIPVTLLTGLTSDSQAAGVTAQVRQDVYDSLTGTHLLIPQGSKLVGSGGGTSGRRMSVSFNRIILPNGASIKLNGSHAADSQGYTGLRDKYDEKWGPTVKGAVLAGIFTGIADWIGDIDTKETSGGGLMRSAWGNVAENISNRISDKADALDKREAPAVKIRPGFQFHVYLTNDIDIYQFKPLTDEPR